MVAAPSVSGRHSGPPRMAAFSVPFFLFFSVAFHSILALCVSSFYPFILFRVSMFSFPFFFLCFFLCICVLIFCNFPTLTLVFLSFYLLFPFSFLHARVKRGKGILMINKFLITIMNSKNVNNEYILQRRRIRG